MRQVLRLRILATGQDLDVLNRAVAEIKWISFSADGQALFIVVREHVASPAVLARIESTKAHLATLATVDGPVSMSPDQSRYAFVRRAKSPERVELVEAEFLSGRAKVRAVRRLPLSIDLPVWSPEGQAIAFVEKAPEANSNRIFLSMPNGDERAIATGAWGAIYELSWADRDGLYMAARESGGARAQIWRIRADSAEVSQITNDLEDHRGVSASRSGAIVSVCRRISSSIAVTDAFGRSEIRQITASFTKQAAGMSWTTAGNLVFHRPEVRGADIWSINPDTNELRQLTFDGARFGWGNHEPTDCGDINLIFWVADRGRCCSLWRMSSTGVRQQEVLHTGIPMQPKCAPDGRYVYFLDAGPHKWPVLSRMLTSGDASPKALAPGAAEELAVSPDGAFVAAFYTKPEHADARRPASEIAVFRADGGPPLVTFPVTPDMSLGSGLAWTPDGKAVAIVRDEAGGANIWALPLNGAGPKQLTRLSGFRILDFEWSRDGRQLALARAVESRDLVLIRFK
jgi:Tol biopolymer transport system component